MATKTTARPRSGLLIGFISLLTLSACAGAGGGATPEATARSTPSASPTPEPVDIAAEFAAQATDLTAFVGEISGTMTVADRDGEISGDIRAAGRDAHTTMVVEFPGGPVREMESMRVSGVAYQRSEHGYWLRMPDSDAASTSVDPVAAALANTENLEVVGTERHGGETLHRIESSRPPSITPAALGFVDPTVAEFEAEVAFLARDDGAPAGLIFTMAWVQGPPDALIPAEMEFRVMLDARPVTIAAPDDPWVRYESAELGYRMDHPASWDVTHEPATGELLAMDLHLGPVDGEVQVYRYTDLAGATANEWFRYSADVLSETLGHTPEPVNMISLRNGLEAQIFIGEVTDAHGTFFFQQAVVFGGDTAWDLTWFSEPGSEVEDQKQLLLMVMSFERADA